jgi:hypothetical protein
VQLGNEGGGKAPLPGVRRLPPMVDGYLLPPPKNSVNLEKFRHSVKIQRWSLVKTTFFKKVFDIHRMLPQHQARSRPLLNLRRKFLNSGVDFLPLSQG